MSEEEHAGRHDASWPRREGCFACPEGGATLAALRQLRASGEIAARRTRVVIFNTGSGLKYLEAWRAALGGAQREPR